MRREDKLASFFRFALSGILSLLSSGESVNLMVRAL